MKNTESLLAAIQPSASNAIRTPGVTAEAVLQTLNNAASPMDLIREGLQQPSVGSVPIQAPMAQPPVSFKSDEATVEDAVVQDLVGAVMPKQEEVVQAKPEISPELAKTPQVPEVIKKGPDESLKDLRKKSNELSQKYKEKESEAETLRAELEKYKTGEALPDVIKEKEDRIAYLEHFENLHGLVTSPHYQKKFIEPLTGLRDKALNIAKEYEVDEGVLAEALKIEGKRELNAFLSDHFDDVGALEIKQVLSQIKDLDVQAQEAQKQPKMSFEQLKTQSAKEEAAREAQRLNEISSKSKTAWVDAVTELRVNGNLPEITLKGDPEHDKIARPILEGAAREYGKLMTFLGAAGIRALPEDVARPLAKRFLLSQAAEVLAASRESHFERAESVLAEVRKTNAILRPPVGSGVPSGNGHVPEKKMTPEQAADELANSILQRRKR